MLDAIELLEELVRVDSVNPAMGAERTGSSSSRGPSFKAAMHDEG